MNIHPKAVERASYRLLVGLILFEVLTVLIYLGSILLTGKPYPPFDMDGRMTVPFLLQAFLLFAIGLMSLILFAVQRQSSQPPSRLLLLTVAVLALYVTADEVFKIHLDIHRLLNHNRDWMRGYVLLYLAVPIVFWRDFAGLYKLYRRETLLALMGMVIVALGGVGSEFLKYSFLQPALSNLSQQHQFLAMFVERSRVAIEEFSEMLGETLIVFSILQFVAKRQHNRSRLQSEAKVP